MKKFNNLFDSICLSITWSIGIFALLAMAISVSLNCDQNNQIGMVIGLLVVLFFDLILTFVIVLKYYSYWRITEQSVQLKKLFRKNITINFSDIVKIEKNYLITFGIRAYRCKAFVIKSQSKEIAIFVNKKNEDFLNSFCSRFSDLIDDKTPNWEVDQRTMG